MKKGKINIVMGGQAGSEAKGKQSAFLVDKFDIKVLAGCLSPNAGHTAIVNGHRLITHHIPAGIAGSKDIANTKVILGPASVINPTLLLREIEELVGWGFDPRNLFIDGRAAIITQWHTELEKRSITKIGSTAQGVGEARVDKLMRRGIFANSISELSLFLCTNTTELLHGWLSDGNMVLYEMGQGFDLCIDHGVDPVYCTSRNCTPMQALADMGVPPSYLGDVYAVIRTYPIRVNNRDGSSGPYPSKEITWEEIQKRCGAPCDITEYTTTTKLKRRVFEFAWERIKKMVKVCNPSSLCLQFANYLDWRYYRQFNSSFSGVLYEFVKELEKEMGIPVVYIGTGPEHEWMMDREVDTW